MHHINLLNWISIFFLNIDEFICEKYINSKNKFIRHRKLTQKDITSYVLIQKGRTNSVESYDFFKRLKNKNLKSATRQAIGKQRKYLDFKVFKDMNNKFIDKIYENITDLPKFKDYLIFSYDGTELKLPNKEEIKKTYKKTHTNLKQY